MISLRLESTIRRLRYLVHKLRQAPLIRVEDLQTAFANAEVTEGTSPAVKRVGLFASLALDGVVSVGASVHYLVLLETVVVR